MSVSINGSPNEPQATGARGLMAIYCDCNSRGGVWSYTVRTLRMFRAWGWRTLLFTHQPRDVNEEQISAELVAETDGVQWIDESRSEDDQIRLLLSVLLEAGVSVFIPNYRKVSYAAGALATRKTPITLVGVCHADHVSYYTVLQRYQDILDTFVCASRKTSRELETYLNPANRERIHYIPHYVEFGVAGRADFCGDRFTVIYHGRVREEQKRCSEIIRVAREVCPAAPGVRFLLLGDGVEQKQYLQQVEAAGLQGKVVIEPSRPWEGVQEALLNSQLAILTSEFEGFCYGAAEAMTAGLPVAAYDCGDVISDFVVDGENGRIVEWGDASCLATWIVDIANDPDRWKLLSDASLARSRQTFGRERISEAYSHALFGADYATRSWPLSRPAYIPERGKSFRSFWERLGGRIGVW